MACGTPLGDVVETTMTPALDMHPGRRPAPAAAAPTQEERRTVTVVFADLSGYTAVAEQLDPESLKGLIEQALRRLGDEVARFGGRVDKYIGDAVMAVFGAPVAHEDDPLRAVRAALGMQDAMEEINARFGAQHGVSFELRVGVNTGEVLAGAVGDAYTVIGDAVNTAQRMQSSAAPGTITVGRDTVRATRNLIAYRELEPLALKGKAEPVPAWQAIGLLDAPAAATEAAPARAPLVGRQDELELLASLAARVRREGTPHLATIVGQAGVGKSRLLHEFESALEQSPDPPRMLRGRSVPYGTTVVYWPLGEVLRTECGIVDGDGAGVAWEKLSRRLGELLADEDGGERSQRARIALIGRLLGIEAPDGGDQPAGEDGQRIREIFFATVRSAVEGMARERPLVLVWEDIHWADEGMLDLIEYLVEWVRAPVLLVCLAREELLERRPSWGAARRNATTLFLDPLADREIVELVGSLLHVENGDGHELVQTVAARAGGNPLFAEEMVRRLTEDEASSAAELPETVHALLAARLDSLPRFERRLLAHASVVGRTFWEGALAGVAAEEGGDLATALHALRGKDLIVAGEGALLTGEPELAFKHVLIRDVAYRTLPKAVRARKHFEVGAFIEERAGERLDEVVALLAEHFGRAAQLGAEVKLDAVQLAPYRERALRYLEAAGDAARAFYSNEEALSHYEAARAQADGNEALEVQIDEKRGDVALTLGRVDTAITLWERCLAYHRGQEDLERVAELHRKIGAALAHKGERREAIAHHQKGINLIKDGPPSTALVRLYEEAAWLYMQTGDNMLAIYAAEKALRLAEQVGEASAASRAHGIFGRVFGRIGDTVKARENLERAVELARATEGHETVLALLALGHHLESAEGDYAAARKAYEEGLGLAREIGEVPAQVELHAALGQLAIYACDWERARVECDAAAELGEREGLTGKLCLPYALQGMLHWREGEWERSERRLRRAHALAEQVGYSEAAFSALHGLALMLRDRGDLAGAEAVLLQALEVCEHAGLIAQSIQASAARALVLTAAGRDRHAREAADQAIELAGRVHYPVGNAAALEAEGVVGPLPESLDRLREARDAWAALGRPLEQARCEVLLGERLREHDAEEANAALAEAADSYAQLGVEHLAARARTLVVG
jgi:predicted ATPase/class 3 adenylate cyclase